MCGIAALIAEPGHALELRALKAMTDAVRHRGPDGDGYVAFCGAALEPRTFGGADTPPQCFAASHTFLPASVAVPSSAEARVALGHRRLAIVDLSPRGYQPMCPPDREHWVVFNGEIYNHVELRDELEALGDRFHSHSDTEVILAAYRRWGEACLQRFNGMFAFVLVDRRAGRMLAARDRFGVKPLYYWHSPAGFVAFASEIKQLTFLPGWKARVNGSRAYDFLERGLADHEDDTLFDGVRQVRGGEMLHCSLADIGSARPLRWYRLAAEPFVGSMDDAAARFRSLFEDSVRLRLRADVSVGSCLSGGLDSSSIVCVASRMLNRVAGAPPQKTFSARSHEGSIDEGLYMEHAVKAARTHPHYVYPELQQLASTLGSLAWHQDEPFGSTSIYAQWKVFELSARHGIRVMLDGQGADELLAGYPGFFSARLSSLAARLKFFSFLREYGAVRRLHAYPVAALVRHLAYVLLPASLLGAARDLVGRGARPASAFITAEALGAPIDVESPKEARHDVHALSLSQLLRTNLPLLLHWEDRSSMAHSVEARLPFLDYRLIEFALGLPEEMLISDGITKRVLREAMRGVLPESIRARTDKIGFATAEERWMRQEQPSLFLGWALRAVEQSGGILKPQAVHVVRDVIEGRRPFSFLPWRIISFGAWMERFAVHA